MPSSSFTLNGWVVGGRHRHHRTRDHFGADSDLYITLEERIGPWGAGTPIKYVIEDLYERITRLSSSTHVIRTFTLNAYVLAPSTTSGGKGVIWLDALVFKTMSSSFVVNAMVIKGGSITLDAMVAFRGSFTLNAFVV